MSIEAAVILGSVGGAIVAAVFSSLLDRRFRRTERRLIDELITMSADVHADFARGCRGLIELYEETQSWLPHRFGEIELRKKILADWTASTQARADLLEEVARRPLSHARARELLAQVETASDRLNGWGIG